MRSRLGKCLVAFFIAGLSQAGSAQLVSYLGCEVEKAGEFVETVSEVYDAMAGGPRPTITLIDNTWNGPDEQTHTLIFEHDDYASLEAWDRRVGGTADAMLVIERAEDFFSCANEGLLVERGSWGNRNAEWNYAAVYPLIARDPAAYAEAFSDLSESGTGRAAPGSIILYERRAGGANATHIVVVQAPSLAALNGYLDTLFSSDDYEDFAERVESIRTLLPPDQSRRIRTWRP